MVVKEIKIPCVLRQLCLQSPGWEFLLRSNSTEHLQQARLSASISQSGRATDR